MESDTALSGKLQALGRFMTRYRLAMVLLRTGEMKCSDYETTGYTPVVFEAMECEGKNNVLVLGSVTGGDCEPSVPAAIINLNCVLGNKLVVGTVNANREYFAAGVYNITRVQLEFPAWLPKLLTHPVRGLEKDQAMMQTLTTERDVSTVFANVAYH
jgi:hypothetical protein